MIDKSASPSSTIPIVRVKRQDGVHAIINKSDFDPELHTEVKEFPKPGQGSASSTKPVTEWAEKAPKVRTGAVPATKEQMEAEVKLAGYSPAAVVKIVKDRLAGVYGEGGRYLIADLIQE